LQSRPERKTSLDKCISKISADYKNDEIRTIQDLTQRIRTLMKHRDLRNDSDFWNSLSEIIGTDHTEKLRKEFKDKPLPKRAEIAERIELDHERKKDMLKLADLVSLFYMVDENGITVTVINADGGPLTLKQYEDIFKFIVGEVVVDEDNEFSSKENRARISEFKKHLELYVPSLYDRLLLILHRFYFNSNCDHLLGDLNYTYRQLKKILPNENLFKDMKNTLKSTCIDEDELVRTYDLVCDLKTFCETRKISIY